MRDSRYVLTWVLGIVLIFPTLPTQAGNAVPVLIWGGETSISPPILVNPLQKTSQAEFEKIVTKKVGGSQRPVLVFVRDNLCVEDFTQHKEGLMHLKDGGSLVYLPAVESPLSTFENLRLYNVTVEEELESVSDGQLIITKAADLDDVSETFNMVKESSPNLVAALTGKSCIYSRSERVRRAVNDSTQAETTEYIYSGNRILFYSSTKPSLKSLGSDDFVAVLGNVTEETENGTSFVQLKLPYSVTNNTNSFNANVVLTFAEKSTGYYTIQGSYESPNTTLDLSSNVDLVFPLNFSYHCSQNVTFVNKTVTFEIRDLQVQVDVRTENGAKKFDDAYDCVGFTTIPIWAGIFVTAILALIMIWGLTMIMDIRTMDRFDDPKGKTITISASE